MLCAEFERILTAAYTRVVADAVALHPTRPLLTTTTHTLRPTNPTATTPMSALRRRLRVVSTLDRALAHLTRRDGDPA